MAYSILARFILGKKVGYGMIKLGVEDTRIGNFFQNGWHKLTNMNEVTSM